MRAGGFWLSCSFGQVVHSIIELRVHTVSNCHICSGMLVVALFLFVSAVVCFGLGFLVKPLFGRSQPGLLQVFALGVCVLVWLSQVVSLVAPVNGWFLLSLLPLAGYFVIKNKSHFGAMRQPALLLSAAVWLLLSLLHGLPVPRHSDSLFYHAQALQWSATYAVVPGLGNLFGRLAFNSSFFTAQSGLSFWPWHTGTPHVLNLLVFVVWSIYLLRHLCLNLSGRHTVFHLCFLLLTLLAVRGWLSSPAPDVMACLLLFMCSFELMQHLLWGKTITPRYLIVLIATAVTVKVSALLLLPVLLAVPGLWFTSKIGKHLFLALLVLLPWFIRNYLLSGFLIYPFWQVDWLQPDWKVSASQAAVESGWIKAWARCMGEQYFYTSAMSLSGWIHRWWQDQTWVNQTVLLLVAAGGLGQLIRIAIRRKAKPVHWLAILYLLPVSVWLFTVPDFRFGHGIMLPALVLHLTLLIPTSMPALPARMPQIVALLVFASFTTVLLLQPPGLRVSHLVWPFAYPPANCRQVKAAGFSISIPAGNCHNHPLPCVNEILLPYNLQPRGKTLQDGFRLAR